MTLSAAACGVLTTSNPLKKARRSRSAAAAWRADRIPSVGKAMPPPRPAHPKRPLLLPPGEMPKRSTGSEAGRIALLHAIAHIELNAIDLAWDLIARFGHLPWPPEFFNDWVAVADDEARHFGMLSDRLAELGAAYGDLPAHDGLWQAAEQTGNDVLARLAVVPLVHEARGLDVTPSTVAKLRAAGDAVSADILDIIYRDEIRHVETGRRWFEHACAAHGRDPATCYREILDTLGVVPKPPFNDPARQAAGFPASWYDPADRPAPEQTPPPHAVPATP